MKTLHVIRDRMFPLLAAPVLTSDLRMLNKTETADRKVWSLPEEESGESEAYYSPLLAGLYFTFLLAVLLAIVLASYRQDSVSLNNKLRDNLET